MLWAIQEALPKHTVSGWMHNILIRALDQVECFSRFWLPSRASWKQQSASMYQICIGSVQDLHFLCFVGTCYYLSLITHYNLFVFSLTILQYVLCLHFLPVLSFKVFAPMCTFPFEVSVQYFYIFLASSALLQLSVHLCTNIITIIIFSLFFMLFCLAD